MKPVFVVNGLLKSVASQWFDSVFWNGRCMLRDRQEHF